MKKIFLIPICLISNLLIANAPKLFVPPVFGNSYECMIMVVGSQDTDVYKNDSDNPVTLSPGDIFNDGCEAGDIYEADKPISGFIRDSADKPYPLISEAFQGTSFSYGNFRSNPLQINLFCVSNSECEVSMEGVSISQPEIFIPSGEWENVTVYNSTSTSMQIESDNPILVYMSAGDVEGDVLPLPPVSNEWIGIISQKEVLSTSSEDDITVDKFNGDGTMETITIGPYGYYENMTNEPHYEGPSSLFESSQPFNVISIADGDGGESTPFLPLSLLSSQLAVPMDYEFIVLVAPYSSEETECILTHFSGEVVNLTLDDEYNNGLARTRYENQNSPFLIECTQPVYAVVEAMDIESILTGSFDNWNGGAHLEDCAGVPNGDSLEDECGICDGDNSTCLDECGVANGDNSTCTDECGVIDGDSSTCTDECGVINGDNSTCTDECGVINGDSNPLDCNNDGIDDFCEDAFFEGQSTGDVNNDGNLTVTDIIIIIDNILND